MNLRRNRRFAAALAGAFVLAGVVLGALVALPVSASATTLPNNPKGFKVCDGTYDPCTIPTSQLAPRHSCPQFAAPDYPWPYRTNQGNYWGYTGIQTSLACGRVERRFIEYLGADYTQDSFMPVQGYKWWLDQSGTQRQKTLFKAQYGTTMEMQRDMGAIQTNWAAGQAVPNPLTMAPGTITFDRVALRTCSGSIMSPLERAGCRNVTLASYAKWRH